MFFQCSRAILRSGYGKSQPPERSVLLQLPASILPGGEPNALRSVRSTTAALPQRLKDTPELIAVALAPRSPIQPVRRACKDTAGRRGVAEEPAVEAAYRCAAITRRDGWLSSAVKDTTSGNAACRRHASAARAASAAQLPPSSRRQPPADLHAGGAADCRSAALYSLDKPIKARRFSLPLPPPQPCCCRKARMQPGLRAAFLAVIVAEIAHDLRIGVERGEGRQVVVAPGRSRSLALSREGWST